MAKKKKSKSEIKVSPSESILKVTDISKIGTPDDPCFGKEYDLSTKECKRCGDSETCAIVFAQFMGVTRKQLETESSFKDIGTDIDAIKKYIRGLIRKGLDRREIVSKVVEKYDMDKKDARSIYRQVKPKK